MKKTTRPPPHEGSVSVLGLDPGTLRTGWGLVRSEQTEGGGFTALAWGLIRMNGKQTLPLRLAKIFRELNDVLDIHHPDEASVENVFHAANARSALFLGQARGAAIAAVASRGIPVFEYTPLDIKKTVAGYGRAEKEQVRAMVCTTLNLEQAPETYDESDALAAAICHAVVRSSPLKGYKK